MNKAACIAISVDLALGVAACGGGTGDRAISGGALLDPCIITRPS